MKAFSDVIAMNRIRLERDLTFRELSTATRIPYRTLFRILSTTNPDMHDRTHFKIRRFLDQCGSERTREAASV